MFASEQYDELIRYANSIISGNPNEPTPYGLRGEVQFKKENFDRAASDFDMAIKILEGRTRSSYWDERLSQYYTTRSACYSRIGSPDRAWIDINKAIALRPNDAASLNNRGVLREYDYQDYKGAFDDYESAMRLAPKETLYQANATRVARRLGK